MSSYDNIYLLQVSANITQLLIQFREVG